MVCYSAKKPSTIYPILNKAFPNLRWILVQVDTKNNPKIYPNHAQLKPQK